MESLQFKVMGRIIEHIERWSRQGLPVLAAKMASASGASQVGSLDMGAVDVDVATLWSGTEAQQLAVVRRLYDATLRWCQLGDWKLGYADVVAAEDGISALLDMCRTQDKEVPSLPLVVLLNLCNNENGSGLSFRRTAHVLTKLALKCACWDVWRAGQWGVRQSVLTHRFRSGSRPHRGAAAASGTSRSGSSARACRR